MTMNSMPCEMLSTVFQRVDNHDVPRLRFVCQKFNSVVKRNYIFLPRIAHIVRIFMKDGLIFITHKKSGNMNGITQSINEFDWNNWREIEIVELEFNNIDTDQNEQFTTVLDTVMKNFWKTKQTRLRKVAFSSVRLNQSCSSQLTDFFLAKAICCENIFVENSSLPCDISYKFVSLSRFDHFRWTNSALNSAIPTDTILRKLQNDMKVAVNKRSFSAEMDAVQEATLCDFIEGWLGLPIASYFNLSLHNCDEMLKTRFLLECEKRQLTHTFMEFQSKTHANAHIKVSFSQDSKTCCVWPIFDVPARLSGHYICHARYFRDFY